MTDLILQSSHKQFGKNDFVTFTHQDKMRKARWGYHHSYGMIFESAIETASFMQWWQKTGQLVFVPMIGFQAKSYVHLLSETMYVPSIYFSHQQTIVLLNQPSSLCGTDRIPAFVSHDVMDEMDLDLLADYVLRRSEDILIYSKKIKTTSVQWPQEAI